MDERGGSHHDIASEHNPLELCPSESRLLHAVSKPSALHAIVVFIVGARHTRLVRLEGLATTTLFVHSRQLFSVSFPRDEACAEFGWEVVHG